MTLSTIQGTVRKRLAVYPAVTVVGPRQCGKTTLAKHLGECYFDLEQESERLRLDLVLDFGSELWAVEVKLTTSPGPGDMDRLVQAADMIGASHRFLVSRTRRSTGDKNRISCNLDSFLDRLQSC